MRSAIADIIERLRRAGLLSLERRCKLTISGAIPHRPPTVPIPRRPDIPFAVGRCLALNQRRPLHQAVADCTPRRPRRIGLVRFDSIRFAPIPVPRLPQSPAPPQPGRRWSQARGVQTMPRDMKDHARLSARPVPPAASRMARARGPARLDRPPAIRLHLGGHGPARVPGDQRA